MSLSELRKEIDQIDEQVVGLLNRRAEIAQEIGRQKARARSHYFTPEREQTVYKRVAALNKGPLPSLALRSIYREIISAAIALEKPLTIGYLGPARRGSRASAPPPPSSRRTTSPTSSCWWSAASATTA
jgi:chorismate mutase/prephenate dehydratase